MPGKAAKVIVTEKQHAILQTFAKSRSVSVSLAQRSKIILLAFEKHNNEEIEALVGLHHDAVDAYALPTELQSYFWPNYDCRDFGALKGLWPNC